MDDFKIALKQQNFILALSRTQIVIIARMTVTLKRNHTRNNTPKLKMCELIYNNYKKWSNWLKQLAGINISAD